VTKKAEFVRSAVARSAHGVGDLVVDESVLFGEPTEQHQVSAF